MPARTPPIWCADLLVNVDPCEIGADCTAQGDRYPRGNEVWDGKAGAIRLAGAANEVVLFQLIVEKRAGQLEGIRLEGIDFPLSLGVNVPVPVRPLQTEQDYRRERKATFGARPRDPMGNLILDDPVVPVDLTDVAGSVVATQKKGPRFKGRRRQNFTVEIHIPKGAPAGERKGELVVRLKGSEQRCPLALRVYGFELPDTNACTADINNYSRVPFPGGLEADTTGDEYVSTMQAYFRTAREHRGMFHLLPYSHSAAIVEGYAPKLAGRGRNRRVADWSQFDKTWGALLDGSNYAGCRFGEYPVEYLYMPVNLNWPAYFENYGKPGFKVEYQNVIREMAAHFAGKGWTKTKMEVFFNHKVRWKFFPWDMDEIYYERDNQATIDFGRWATEAASAHPEVTFINRIDSSWIFDKSARTEMGDCIQLWVVNRGSHSESPDEVKLLIDKGQEVWFYGGPGGIAAADRLDTLRWPWIVWGRETSGFCWWNGLGYKSWEQVDRGGNHLMYPGDRFGIKGPLASLRMKVMLRGQQDNAYLTLLTEKTGSRAAADSIIEGTIGTGDREGWYQREEKSEVGGADIQTTSKTTRPWNTAERDKWDAARAQLAEATEKA
ncbi:MAG: hypothetical protein ACYTGB_02045 [Planctomycetota bacterium]|jgi:hypothetical protein